MAWNGKVIDNTRNQEGSNCDLTKAMSQNLPEGIERATKSSVMIVIVPHEIRIEHLST
jgi:hypothetical protein